MNNLSFQVMSHMLNAIHENEIRLRGASAGEIPDALRGPSKTTEPCSICQDALTLDEEVFTLPCKHAFHIDCLTPWGKDNNTCPNCRAVFTEHDVNAPSEDDEEVVFEAEELQIRIPVFRSNGMHLHFHANFVAQPNQGLGISQVMRSFITNVYRLFD